MGIRSHIHSILKKTGTEEIDQTFKSLDQKVKALSEIREKRQKKDDVTNEFKPQNSFRPMEGTYLKDIDISTGGTKVTHGLERDILGFIVININANTNIWNTTPTDFDKKLHMRLQAGANCKVSLWVF